MFVKDYKIPLAKCPGCGAPNDGAFGISENEEKPKAGDLSICMNCQGIHIFKEDFTLREPTETELLEMPLYEITRAQRIITEVKQEK